MPYKDMKDRDHKEEYKKFLALGGRAKQTERQKARREFDAEHGYAARKGKALDHVKPIKSGGKSTAGNVKVMSFSANSAKNFKSKKSSG